MTRAGYCAALTALVACVAGANVSSTKPGLAWGAGGANMEQFMQADTISWFYVWGETNWLQRTPPIEFVPMLWGERNLATWQATIEGTIRNNNVTHVLAYNEPNHAGQADMTPQRGAEIWRSYIQPLKASHNLTLVSPVPTSAPTGPMWLQEFIDACGPECTIDVIALHYYGTNATSLIQYVEQVYAQFQRPIWLTEFACHSFTDPNDVATPAEISAFMNTTVDFLESAEYVQRYAWFGVMTEMEGMNPYNRLLDSEGRINYLGLQYIGEGTWSTASPPPTFNGTSSNVTRSTTAGLTTARPTFVPDPEATNVSREDEEGGWPSIGFDDGVTNRVSLPGLAALLAGFVALAL